MTRNLTRRKFVKSAAATGLGAAALVSGAPFVRRSRAAEPLKATSWGGMWLENMKAITDTHDPTVDWSPFSGGSGGLITQQKAVWPKLLYDFTANWDPNFRKMYNEGWLETVTEADMPNLKDLPPSMLKYSDDTGVYGIPMSHGAFFWGYREDMVDIEINDIEDLLHPSLKGLICGNPPPMHNNLTIASMSMGVGGSETDLAPGWEFQKKLAQSGNIGRVVHGDVDLINSINLGETAVGFAGVSNWNSLKENHPIRRLNKVPGSKGMKTFYYTEGCCIFKGPRAAEAKSVVNHMISAEQCGNYNAAIGQLPANLKSPVPDSAADISMTDAELQQFGYIPDWALHSKNMDDATKYWEQEIQPLIRFG